MGIHIVQRGLRLSRVVWNRWLTEKQRILVEAVIGTIALVIGFLGGVVLLGGM